MSSNKRYFLPPLPTTTESNDSMPSPNVTIMRNDTSGNADYDNEGRMIGTLINNNKVMHEKNHEGMPQSAAQGENRIQVEEMVSPLMKNNDKKKAEDEVYHDVNHRHSQEQFVHQPLQKQYNQQERSTPTSSHTNNNRYKWPLPFDDENAYQSHQFQTLPIYNHDQIKTEIHETKQISIRIITWNQHAKSIPAYHDDKDLYHQLFFMKPSNSEVDQTTRSCNGNDDDGYSYGYGEKMRTQNGEGQEKKNCHYHHHHHLIIVGTQECENSISKSILNPIKERWEKCCIEALGEEYMLVQGHALQASHLAVFAHQAIVHLITNIQSHAVPTGICNTLGNKGGIGITLNIGKSSFCFLTAHLAAHQDQIDRRTLDFECISKEIANKLGKKKHAFNQSDSFDDNIINGKERNNSKTPTTSESIDETIEETEYTALNLAPNGIKREYNCCCSKCFNKCCCCCREGRDGMLPNPLLKKFDFVFWGGDLNYRINATRDVVDSLLEENRHDVLMANDQLNLLLQFEKTFNGFNEGPMTFRPTYKYDTGTDVYDTSSKRRIPSWTDRVLYKIKPELELMSYFCSQKIRVSDHRPVYASFKCTIDIDAEEASLDTHLLRSESRSEVCVIS